MSIVSPPSGLRRDGLFSGVRVLPREHASGRRRACLAGPEDDVRHRANDGRRRHGASDGRRHRAVHGRRHASDDRRRNDS